MNHRRTRIPESLEHSQYSNVESFSRTLHFADLRACYRQQTFVPSYINSRVVDIDRRHKVLWFGPSLSPEQHNKYGNISFTISIDRLLKRFGNHFFYLDQSLFASHTCTRLFLPKDPGISSLNYVDIFSDESILRQVGDKWQHVSKWQGSSLHELELAIEVNSDDCSWLYHQCILEPTEHSLANSKRLSFFRYDSQICHHYNNYNLHCPNDYSRNEAKSILREEFQEI